MYLENCDFTQDFVEQFVEGSFDRVNGETQNNNFHYDTSSLDALITLAEVKKAISKLKRNKSPGCDLLPPELFLDSIDLFNFIFSNGVYPD